MGLSGSSRKRGVVFRLRRRSGTDPLAAVWVIQFGLQAGHDLVLDLDPMVTCDLDLVSSGSGVL